MCRTNEVGLIYATRSVVKSWRMLVLHDSHRQKSYRLNRSFGKLGFFSSESKFCMLSMYCTCLKPAFIWTSTQNEWNAHNTIWSRVFGPSITRNLIMHVLNICQVRLTQSTGQQKCFNLQSLLLTFHNFWLKLLVIFQFIYSNTPFLELSFLSLFLLSFLPVKVGCENNIQMYFSCQSLRQL